ncbi:MAG: hypothetical protein LAT51_10825 [Flavobacteriaceae bacterium]|nr:hypothetical protein [Flavobacteriaceae bacterium]
MSTKNNLSLIVIVCLLIASFFAFLWYEAKNELQVKAKLVKAENLFIQAEYDEAFEIYSSLNLAYVDEDFINLRKELAGMLAYKEASEDFNELKINLISLLAECPFSKKTSDNIEEKSLASLAILLKECYLEAKYIKNEKTNIVESLSSIKYLNFENERGFNIHYLGQVKDSLALGEGVGIWDNDMFYRGQWKNNKREGEGYFKTAKDETYQGQFRNDRRNGYGKYVFRNGDYYVGEWKDGERSGYGTVIDKKGDTLVHGYWENDRYNRRKTRRYERGDLEE